MRIIRSKDIPAVGAEQSTFIAVDSSPGRFYLSRTTEGKILYNARGDISLNVESMGDLDVGSGKMVFIPPSSSYTIRIRNNSSFYIYRLSLKLHFTESSIPMQWLYACRSASLPSKNAVMDVHEKIAQYFHTLGGYMEDELSGYLYYTHKARELLILMKNYYHPRQLAEFFSPIIDRDHEFSDFIIGNYRDYRTVQEMADASCHSLSAFNRLFRKNFGCAPYTWIKQQRANDIFKDLTITNNPIKQISSDHGFGSLSQFTTFCKRHFGVSPRRLREMHEAAEFTILEYKQEL